MDIEHEKLIMKKILEKDMKGLLLYDLHAKFPNKRAAQNCNKGD